VTLGVAMLVCTSASALGAAGDTTLDRLIVKSPVPGWDPIDAARIEHVAATESQVISAAANEPVKVAVRGWQSGRSSIVIILSRFPQDVPTPDLNARQAVISACTSATNSSNSNVHVYEGLATASEASCTGRTANGTPLSVDNLSWAKRNVFALIISSGLPAAEVEAIAGGQDALIPASGVSRDSGSAASVIGGAVFAIVVVLIIGVPIALFVRSRRNKPVPGFATTNWSIAPGGDWSMPAQPPPTSAAPGASTGAWGTPAPYPAPGQPPPASQPAPAPAAMQPGWQPVAGDPYRQAYWDGSRWTAQKRWDGTNWIDV
jgi:hypothetical protein